MKKVGGIWVKKNGQPSKWHNEARGPMGKGGAKPIRIWCYVCKRQVRAEEWVSGKVEKEGDRYICLICKEYRDAGAKERRLAFARELLAMRGGKL